MSFDKRTIRRIHDRLARAYGDGGPLTHPRRRPLDVLVQTILSQNTSDTNSLRAYRSLRKRYPRWEQVAQAGEESIADCIRMGGLAEIKSARIRNVLQGIRKAEGRVSLARLNRMTDAEAMEYLTSFPGVGVKTASCVLMFALRRPVMPVDTHVYRIAGRLGIIDADVRIDDTGPVIEALTPPGLALSLHLALIEHGRRTCRARNPLCPACPVRRYCAHVNGSLEGEAC